MVCGLPAMDDPNADGNQQNKIQEKQDEEIGNDVGDDYGDSEFIDLSPSELEGGRERELHRLMTDPVQYGSMQQGGDVYDRIRQLEQRVRTLEGGAASSEDDEDLGGSHVHGGGSARDGVARWVRSNVTRAQCGIVSLLGLELFIKYLMVFLVGPIPGDPSFQNFIVGMASDIPTITFFAIASLAI